MELRSWFCGARAGFPRYRGKEDLENHFKLSTPGSRRLHDLPPPSFRSAHITGATPQSAVVLVLFPNPQCLIIIHRERSHITDQS